MLQDFLGLNLSRLKSTVRRGEVGIMSSFTSQQNNGHLQEIFMKHNFQILSSSKPVDLMMITLR